MSQTFAPPQSSLDKLDAALGRLAARHGFCRISPEQPFTPGAGLAVLLLTDDPQRNPESLDVAVVLPEALASLKLDAARWAADSRESPALARQYGVQRYPAVVVFQDGAYLGTFSGILDWAPFLESLARLVTSQPSRPPISIARA